jgi:hypothetical protein
MCNSNRNSIESSKSHYLDEGCICLGCNLKRENIKNRIKRGEIKMENIIHDTTKKEIINNRIRTINKMNKEMKKKNKMSMINFPTRG